tara:strand:- start:8 stop:436 length:429 start_codon:yes stop_codon:yes gene_type:complete
MNRIPVGKAQIRREGRDVALLAFGTMLTPALEAAEALGATVVNMRSVKPLDVDLILDLAGSHELLVSIEENTVRGGAGAGVSEILSETGCDTPLLILGLPDQHVDQGDPAAVLSQYGLDAEGIRTVVQRRRPLQSVTSRSSA